MNELRIPNAPLFRDPIFDGAADPTIIWNHEEKAWWILYTNRRAGTPPEGVAWVHGTDIGIAESKDNGKTWLYRGTIEGLNFERGHNTYWAPEIIYVDGIYHMHVSYVKGIPNDWKWDRKILHYTSKNLWDWEFVSELKLSSNKVIDSCIYQLPNGKWRMWYKDEVNKSHTYAADSDDLYKWEVVGPVITDCAHEGPNVFELGGNYWLITDAWCGLGIYKSSDCINWVRQENNILEHAGKRTDDGTKANHADVLVQDDKAYIFYFTHPERLPDAHNDDPNLNKRNLSRSSLQVAQLKVIDGKLVCDRDEDFDFYLASK
jgi:hypothetical protein